MRPASTPVTLNDGAQPHWPVDPNDDNLHPGKPVAYGFGWFLDPFEGPPAHVAHWQHHGIPHGDRAVYGGARLTIVVLCNRTDLDPEKLALRGVRGHLDSNFPIGLIDLSRRFAEGTQRDVAGSGPRDPATVGPFDLGGGQLAARELGLRLATART